MRLTIHDANQQKVGWIDNDKQETLNFYGDLWRRQRKTGSSVFEFTVTKKALQTDVGTDRLYTALNERGFVSFKYKGRTFMFTVMRTEETESTIYCYCEYLNLELLNEMAQPYESAVPMSFVDYCKAMDLLNYTMLTIGINEVASEKLALTFDQQETKLARLLNLVSAFGAENEFETQLKPDSTVKKFLLNVYKAHDSEHQGVGTRRDDLVLKYGNGLRGITRTVSKENLYTMVVPVGKRSDVTKSKRTTVTNPDGTKTITDKVSNSDNSYTTTTTIVDRAGKVLSTKKVVATKNSDGTITKNTTSNASGSTVTAKTSSSVVTNPDKSTTKTTTTVKSDGTTEKTTVHTKTEQLANKTTRTTVTTTKPDGTITQKVTTKYSNGTSNSETKTIKQGSSSKSTTTSKVDSASDEQFDLSDFKDWSKKNAKGELEFYKRGVAIYAPLAAQLYPAAFTSDTMADQWIRYDVEFEADSEEELNAKALEWLEARCYPSVTYEVDGYLDGEPGDTIRVEDSKFSKTLLLSARIEEQQISFTNPSQNKTTIENAQAIESKLSSGIQQRLDTLLEEAKPYTIKLATDNGVAFKNGQGQSVITPTLYRGGKPITTDVTWRWTIGEVVKTGMTYTVNATDVIDTLIIKIAAYIIGDEVASDELTFTNVNDGVGIKGDAGTSVTVSKIEYQAGTSPTSAPTGAWSTSVVTAPAGQYLWTKTTYSDGKTAFTVAKQGDTGTFDDDLSVENLLRGTKDMIKKGNTPKDDWYLEGAVLVDETVDGYPFTFKKWSSGAKTSPSIEMTVKSGVEYTFTAYIARENVGRLYFYLYDTWDYHITSATRRETIIQNVGPEIQRFKITFVPTRNGKIRPRFAMLSSDQGWFMTGGYKLNRGPIASNWSQAPEDINQAINSKADQVLTQTQLTQLQEANSLLENEIKARLTQQALLDWAEEYNKAVTASTDEAKAKAEDALKKSAERLAEVTKLGEKAQKWETTTGYIQADDDGLTIAKDGSDTKFIVTNDVISFVSGGKAVMTLTKGELKVDNGVFALSVRLGRFVEAPLESNPDINVIRYVGGVV